MHFKQEKREGMVIKKERLGSILQTKMPVLNHFGGFFVYTS